MHKLQVPQMWVQGCSVWWKSSLLVTSSDFSCRM